MKSKFNLLIETPESVDLPQLDSNECSGGEIVLEYKIDGMTCVNCTNTIEGAMNNEYQGKGMKKVQIALLTHKMRIVFDLKSYHENQITPDVIKDEVEMVGFGAELLEVVEINNEVN